MTNARRNAESWQNEDLIEKLVVIKRTAKVVKGGSRFNFSAIVVVGNGRGMVGYGLGKAKEVPESIRKATEQAKKSMVAIPIRDGRTLHHEMVGKYGSGSVVLRPAADGTGIIAGGSMRPIFEALGIRDILAKSTGTSNPHNLIKATFKALLDIRAPEEVAAKRGMTVKQVWV
ncbi:MAG: 30S ribosomal protein S5 [Magnetococcales bacterium]|nr:30S ribosomal protein S5 [Magnetococcales bacterium]MBF0321999.1 30S ribosomal protein S5 [Magnetococcales bacterium]